MGQLQKLILQIIFLPLVALAGPTHEEFESYELPEFKTNYERDFFNLRKGLYIIGLDPQISESYLSPFVGKTDFIFPAELAPWAGNYFPMYKGGLANRWQTRVKINVDKLNSKAQLKKMTAEEINLLSPIEKYDIFIGDYSYAGTLHELYNRGPLREMPLEDWEGFCNGVRCAGIHLPEPEHPVEVSNPDGIKIVFQPADLKALSGASYFFVEKYSQMGSPSQGENMAEDQPNPAIFDLALRYFVGEMQKAFVIDSHLGSEIWNETVIGFHRELQEVEQLTEKEQEKWPEAFGKVRVKVNLMSLSETKIQDSNSPTKVRVSEGLMHKNTKIEYTLYLDEENKAIDGIWKPTKQSRGVDFVWFSGGRGTDSKNPQGNGNTNMSFKVIKNLVYRSNEPILCSTLFE